MVRGVVTAAGYWRRRLYQPGDTIEWDDPVVPFPSWARRTGPEGKPAPDEPEKGKRPAKKEPSGTS